LFLAIGEPAGGIYFNPSDKRTQKKPKSDRNETTMSAIKLHKSLEDAKASLAKTIKAKKGGVHAARRALLAAETAAAPLETLFWLRP
jgi:hypothetical protein